MVANVRSSMFGNNTNNMIEKLAAEQESNTTSKWATHVDKNAGKRIRDTDNDTDITGIRRHLDRQLSTKEVLTIDESLARFCYSEALPFSAFQNSEFRSALGKLNQSWAAQTRLSDWTLRHEFLDNCYDAVSGEVAEKVTTALFVCLISDGWSGVQKKHILNILLSTPAAPYYLDAIHTKEDAVDGEYQAALFANIIRENGGMDKVGAICTDNASVMRKTWRLLRAEFNGLFTYGCAPHAFNLHAKDICALPEFAALLANTKTITNWFSSHLQKDGRATLDRFQIQVSGKTHALSKAGKTRWASQITSALSVIRSQQALTLLVMDSDFDLSKTGAEHLRTLIVDMDASFWLLLKQWVASMEPMRLALYSLQSDSALLSDVYASFLRMQKATAQRFSDDGCLFRADRQKVRKSRVDPTPSPSPHTG